MNTCEPKGRSGDYAHTGSRRGRGNLLQDGEAEIEEKHTQGEEIEEDIEGGSGKGTKPRRARKTEQGGWRRIIPRGGVGDH